MANKVRGDVEFSAGGRAYTMRLTLGALAEIEDGLGLADLSEIEARLKKLRASDLAVVAAALLRGGGHDMTPADVLPLPTDIGALVRAVTDTFAATAGADSTLPLREGRPATKPCEQAPSPNVLFGGGAGRGKGGREENIPFGPAPSNSG